MKYSQLFGKTVRLAPKDIALISHKLLYQAGYIRESTAGRYYILPLGMRVHRKIEQIIKEEMDKSGAQEIMTPILHPKYLWKETNRTASVGFELMSINDKNGMEFVLGGTAEEMIVDLSRKFQISYKDLPFNLYQFSMKFRDELRARGGLLRLREFVMKDAYSFHATEEDFRREYENMRSTYSRIFNRIGLKTVVVEADNGYIGGDYSHEFVVESDSGESKYFTTGDGDYAAHEEVAKSQRIQAESKEKEKPMTQVLGKGIIGVEELAKYLNIPVENTTKVILFEDESGDVIAAGIMGGYTINEAKLKSVSGALTLTLASEKTVKRVTGSEVGYAGLLNLHSHVRVFMDISMKGRRNFEMGANRTNYHSINVNFVRDLPLPEKFYDIAVVREGDTAQNGQKLLQKRGIEVGNIFQLGYHYSKLMKDAVFTDLDGEHKPFYMGCYGLGLERTMAAVVEVHHDEKGIIWPETIAPFDVQLVSLTHDGRGEKIYDTLIKEGLDVLFDDRAISAGEKFADCDLLGIPVRLVISQKSGAHIEWKNRTEVKTELLSVDEVISRVRAIKKATGH